MKMKKIIASVIAAAMMLGAMGTAVFAEESTTWGTKYIKSDTVHNMDSDDTLVINGQIKVENSATLTVNGGNVNIKDFTSSWAFYACAGKIVFNNVNITATNIEDYIFMANYGKSITLNNCTVTVNNAYCMFYSDPESGTGILNLNNTKVYLQSGCDRIALGTKAYVNLTNGSLIDADGLSDTAFRNVALSIDDSEMDINGCERCVKNDDGSAVTITGTSRVSVSGATEAAFVLSKGAAIYATSDASITVDSKPYTDFTLIKTAIAKIGDVEYETLQGALKEAKSGDTVEVLADVTVEGELHDVYIPEGVILDGGNHSISVGSVKHYSKNALFYSDGEVTVKNLTVGATTATGTSAFNFANGGTLENVTVNSAFSNGVYTDKGVTATKCTFNNLTWGIYNESAASNVITDCTFNNSNAAILRGNDTFNGNTLNNSLLSVVSANAAISENNIGSSTVEIWGNDIDLSKNYWGGNAPAESQFKVDSTYTYKVDNYYTELNEDGSVNNESLVELAYVPEAEVTILDAMTLPADGYMVWPSGDDSIERPLEVIMNFKATETKEEAAAGPFADWKTDFYVTVTGCENGSVIADDCYLAGNYGTIGWIVIPLDGTEVENGISYPVVSVYDANLTYTNICDYVKDFTAAIHIAPEILEANPNFKVSLALKMTNSKDETDVRTVGEVAEYTADDLMQKAVAKIGDVTYTNLIEALDAAEKSDNEETTVELLCDINLTGSPLSAYYKKYHFITNVEGGVTVTFDHNNWVDFANGSIGENVTFKADNFLLSGRSLVVRGNIDTNYLYTCYGATTTIEETAVVNVRNGSDATVQVKHSDTVMTVKGTLNCGVLNVWEGTAKLIVSGDKAKVDTYWFDCWSGTPSALIENGATMIVDHVDGLAETMKASRGGTITVNNATVKTDTLVLGHDGTAGVISITGNSTFAGSIKLTTKASTVTGPEGLNVTTTVEECEISYSNGTYSVVEEEDLTAIFGSPLAIINMPIVSINVEGEDVEHHRVGLISAIDSLKYDSVGFEFKIADYSKQATTTKVYKAVTNTNNSGETETHTAEELGGEYMFCHFLNIPTTYDEKEYPLYYRPFATLGEDTIYGSAYVIEDYYTIQEAE